MKTKIISLALSLGLCSTLTYAKPTEYTIVHGGGEQIDPKYVGRKVLADFKLEANKGRIIGPAENEKLYFFKSLKLLNKK